MANAMNAYDAYQHARWMRPDAHRWLRPDAMRFLIPGSDPAKIFPALDRKFNPNQPRVPAGSPDGGQWTDGGGGREGDENDLVQDILAKAKELRLTGSSSDYRICLNLCYPILERLSPRWSDRNTWDFHKCMNACLGHNR